MPFAICISRDFDRMSRVAAGMVEVPAHGAEAETKNRETIDPRNEP
jgi:hypothetical protein